jgi:hypothetical protein
MSPRYVIFVQHNIISCLHIIVLQNIIEYYLAGEYDKISTEVDRYIARVWTK